MTTVTESGPDDGKRRGISGFSIILSATVVAGVASYAVTWLVPHVIGLSGYAVFAIFWAFLYLVVGALSGIQQEVARATSRAESAHRPGIPRARNFAIVSCVCLLLLITLSSPLWSARVFAAGDQGLVWPLAVGTSSYLVVAALAGSLYGISRWRPLGVLIAIDALLRLLAIAVVLAFTHDVVALAWAVAFPFPLAPLIVWPFIRRSVVGRLQLDVGYRDLSWNVLRTVLAAASTGVMVSGFPLLLGLTSRGVSTAVVGLFILTITLTRAPLIIVAMSLQSYFTVLFRDSHGRAFWRRFLLIEAVIIAGGAVLAPLGWWLGPAVFSFLFPGKPTPDGPLIALVVLSSALVGAMCVTAPAVLARSQHVVYSAGWVAGALATIATLLLPIDFASRTVAALLAGPTVGLLVHLSYLAAPSLLSRRARI
jgi:O-antigen/teichoic acid export membrane protein